MKQLALISCFSSLHEGAANKIDTSENVKGEENAQRKYFREIGPEVMVFRVHSYLLNFLNRLTIVLGKCFILTYKFDD